MTSPVYLACVGFGCNLDGEKEKLIKLVVLFIQQLFCFLVGDSDVLAADGAIGSEVWNHYVCLYPLFYTEPVGIVGVVIELHDDGVVEFVCKSVVYHCLSP
jgi:hypothetical protein